MSVASPTPLGGGGVVNSGQLSGTGVLINSASVPGGVNSNNVGSNGGAAAVPAGADHFCLRWNNYQINMTSVFDQLLQEEVFVDVTLSCEGGSQLRAHKVVLAACSPYFQAVLQNNPCKHPIIILPRDVAFVDLRAIIEFVYRGEIDVAQEQINSLLQTADTLKIKGLCEVGDDPLNCPPGFTATPSTARVPPVSSQSQTTSSTFSNSNSVASPARTRGTFSRGRFNSAYRPRGRPPVYGRSPVERTSSSKVPPLSRELRESKRIKVEGDGSNDNGEGNARVPPANYQNNQQNGQWDENAGSSQGGQNFGNYSYVKSEDRSGSQGGAQPGHDSNDTSAQRMTVTPELMGLMPPNQSSHFPEDSDGSCVPSGRKLWTDEDMEKALDALRTSSMSLSRAAHVYGIPATTLWQRAHRMGIETPKKEGPNKTWSEHDLAGALEELRSGRLSANRASKEYGIPNSTLYKIARKEGIKLSSPFSAIQPSWNPEDLNRALDAIRGGMSVQKSATEFGIPTGTLYGRCRREGIELSKYQGVPWSEEDMKDALEAVRVGEMSINQAAIHYNLPYSSLYGRFKRGKYEDGLPHQDFLQQEMTIDSFSGGDQSMQPNQVAANSQQSSLQSTPPELTPPPPHHQQSMSATGHPAEQY